LHRDLTNTKSTIKLAKSTPDGVLFLDVRNTDEANAGMIKGAPC